MKYRKQYWCVEYDQSSNGDVKLIGEVQRLWKTEEIVYTSDKIQYVVLKKKK